MRTARILFVCALLSACEPIFTYRAWFAACSFENYKFFPGEPATLVFCVDGHDVVKNDSPTTVKVVVTDPSGANVETSVSSGTRRRPGLPPGLDCPSDDFEQSAAVALELTPPIAGLYQVDLAMSGPKPTDGGRVRFRIETLSAADPPPKNVTLHTGCGQVGGEHF